MVILTILGASQSREGPCKRNGSEPARRGGQDSLGACRASLGLFSFARSLLFNRPRLSLPRDCGSSYRAGGAARRGCIVFGSWKREIESYVTHSIYFVVVTKTRDLKRNVRRVAANI